MTGQTTSEQALEKFNPGDPPVYDVWMSADGSYENDETPKDIKCRSRNKDKPGYAKVSDGDEEYLNSEKTYHIPAKAAYRIHGCRIMFLKA